MFARLFLLFTVTSVIELTLLIQIGKLTGVGTTVALIVLTGLLGAYLTRREGRKTLAKLREDALAGRPTAGAITDGALILVAGAVLLTPGFLTDLLGFSLLIPAVRGRLRQAAADYAKRHVQVRAQTFASGFGRPPQPPGDVFDVEFERVEEPPPAIGG